MDEKIAKLTVLFILMAIVSWIVALCFFVAHLTSWQVRYLFWHPTRNRGSYMSAHVLLNLLNKLRKRDKM